MADVLRGVMAVDNQPYGILRISSPGSNVSGRLAIAESQFIVGAQVSDGSDEGYAAVRRLLLAQDGNFAYLDTGGKRPQDCDHQTLYISLRKMAEAWPNLPEDPNALFDEEALLDKVFGGDGQLPADPSGGNLPVIQSHEPQLPRLQPPLLKTLPENAISGGGSATSAHKQAWKTIVQPLLSNSLVEGTKTVEGRPAYMDFDDTASHERQSLTKLRAAGAGNGEPWVKTLLKESFFQKRALMMVLIVLMLAALATFISMGALN